MKGHFVIDKVAVSIMERCSPINIILVSNKIDTTEKLISFKLAVVVNDDVKSISELECNLYMQVDSEVPYDLVLYKLSEWNKLKYDIGTFAWKIYNSGVYLYGTRV